MYRKQLIHTPRSPRLWEEELDETELDFINADVHELAPDTNILSMNKIVVRKLIRDNLDARQRVVVEAFMEGKTHAQVSMTEKAWRYRLETAIKTMREILLDDHDKSAVKYYFNRRIYEYKYN
jgi:hypothetical protein